MTAPNYLYIIVVALAVLGWETWVHAEGDVTIVSPPASTANTPVQKALAPDGTPVVHKSSHKKTSEIATASMPKSTNSAPVAAHKPGSKEPSYTAIITEQSASLKIPSGPSAPIRMNQVAPAAPHPVNPPSTVPTVETDLPIARHAGPDGADGTPIPSGATLPSAGAARPPLFASAFPLAPVTSANVGLYSSSNRSRNPAGDFPFANFSRKVKNIYPWKTNIYTTMFYIGEGGSSISPTDNKASSFDEHWVSSNHGTDNPYDRNGYASGSHASTVNPFYIALPFNDLACPDKAREWLPAGWRRPNKDGKQVSACKDRWVEIKTEDGSGHTCYAQWEDVGPLRYDHAEYVFGNERPDTYTRAGLDVSPAVAQYLNINGDKRATTRWRFVDDEDVQPGPWLTLDEQAVLYRALHQLKNASPTTLPSIQREAEPIDDPANLNSNKKKVGAAKG